MKTVKLLIVLTVLLGCSSSLVRADLIKIGVTARVSYLYGENGIFIDKLHLGDAVTGYYIYDPTIKDGNPDPQKGIYLFGNPPTGIFLNIGDFIFQTTPDSSCMILLTNAPGVDRYEVQSGGNLIFPNGQIVRCGFSWRLEDTTGTALNSDKLPLEPPNITDFQTITDLNISVCGYPAFWIGANEISVELIPEPVTILLFSLGIMLARKKLAQ